MAQMAPEACKLLRRALSLPIDQQEALANALISHLRNSALERLSSFGKAHMLSLDGIKIKDLINHGRR